MTAISSAEEWASRMKAIASAGIAIIATLAIVVGTFAQFPCASEEDKKGECDPLRTTTTAPPPSACDSPCPTSTCGAACVVLDWDPDPDGGTCSNIEEINCTQLYACDTKANLCRTCTCDPITVRCVDGGTLVRTGLIYKNDCFN